MACQRLSECAYNVLTFAQRSRSASLSILQNEPHPLQDDVGVSLAKRKMAETEADRLSSSYNLFEDTMDTDTLVQLREPMLQPAEESHNRTGSLHRLRHSKVYTALASTKNSMPQYVKEDAREDVIT